MDNFRRIGFLRPDDIPSSFQSGDSYVEGDKIAAIIFPIGDNYNGISITFTTSNLLRLWIDDRNFVNLGNSTEQRIIINSLGTVRSYKQGSGSGTYLYLIQALQKVNSTSSSPYAQATYGGFYYNKNKYNFPDTWYSFYFDVYGCSYVTTTSLPSNWYWKPYVEE